MDPFRVAITILSIVTAARSAQILDTSAALLSRHKRTLVWFEGVNWVQMIVGIGLPTELHDQSITVGTVAKAFYLLPTNSSFYTHPGVDFLRRRKRTAPSRWSIYKTIELFFEGARKGSGRVCMLRAICEASHARFDSKSGILAEILHILLRPSSTEEELGEHLDNQYHAAESLGRSGAGGCGLFYPECRLDALEKFSKFLS